MIKHVFSLLTLFLSAQLSLLAQNVCVTEQLDGIEGIDASISNRSDYINSNYGDLEANRIFSGTGQNVGSNVQDWRFLTTWSFLDEIPEGATIVSASITMQNDETHDYYNASGTNAVKIYLTEESWSENQVTWSNQPTYRSDLFVELAERDNNFTELVIDIKTLVTEIVENGYENNGFVFKMDVESPYKALTFGSSDNSTESLRPTWSVCYTEANVTSTQVVEHSANSVVSLFPVPASDKINFSETISGVLYNSVGVSMNEFDNQSSLDLSSYDSGLYFIKTSTGQIHRFIIE